MLVEALAGAEYQQIADDYMVTYDNYYGITAESEPDKYKTILEKNLDAMIEEDQNESSVRTSLQSLFQDWEFGIGFDGAIWPCYQEFLEHDYPLMLKAINT